MLFLGMCGFLLFFVWFHFFVRKKDEAMFRFSPRTIFRPPHVKSEWRMVCVCAESRTKSKTKRIGSSYMDFVLCGCELAGRGAKGGKGG